MSQQDRAAAAAIAARCKRIGWEVQPGGAKALFKITPPGGHREIFLHSSPSDANWEKVTLRQLDAAGFADAEEKWLAKHSAQASAKTAAGQRAAAAATRKAERQAAAVVAAAGPYAVQPVNLGWLTTPTDVPDTKTVLISPEVAAKVLDTMNTHNRPLSEKRWRYLAQTIRDGEWAATHQGGAIDTNGVLLDGQHRLRAIVDADQTVAMMWSVGMPPENFRKVDTGTNRTARDAAAIRHEVDPTILTAAAKLLLAVDRFGPDAHIKARSARFSIDTVDSAIEHVFGDRLREAVRQARAIKYQLKRANASSVAAAIWLIETRLPNGDERVTDFFEAFRMGEGISRPDPVWFLRRTLFNAGSGRENYTTWEQLALILKAWNHRAGAKGDARMSGLAWRSNETFPSVVFLPPPPVR